MIRLFCLKANKRCLNRGKNEQKVTNNGNKNYFFLFFICLTMATPDKITDIKRRGAEQTWSANGISINKFNRFTVCPLWPLGKSPIKSPRCVDLVELVIGVEPTTC